MKISLFFWRTSAKSLDRSKLLEYLYIFLAVCSFDLYLDWFLATLVCIGDIFLKDYEDFTKSFHLYMFTINAYFIYQDINNSPGSNLIHPYFILSMYLNFLHSQSLAILKPNYRKMQTHTNKIHTFDEM